MYRIQTLERKVSSPASPHGQGIVAAPKAYFAKQSMERERRGTAQSPVFATGKNGPKKKATYSVAKHNDSMYMQLPENKKAGSTKNVKPAFLL